MSKNKDQGAQSPNFQYHRREEESCQDILFTNAEKNSCSAQSHLHAYP